MNESNHRQAVYPQVILFDLNGTLLDLDDIKRRVNRILDSKRGFACWMEFFLHYSLVDSCTGQHHSFTDIAKAATAMAARAFDTKVNDQNLEDVFELMKHLPLNEGVGKGLSLLHDQGARLAVLTNLPANIANERMNRTGLISYFETIVTAEEVKKYKPCVETYQWAAARLGVEPKNVLMVTAHSWDICGAANAGMKTAFVGKDQQGLYELAPKPQYIVRNVIELAKTLRASAPFIAGAGQF